MKHIAHITGLLLLLLAGLPLRAQYRDDQFKRDAFSQNYDTTDTAPRDSSQLFNFREYFGGLSHRRSASLKTLFMGSTVFVGGEQIYNRQYWKLPLVYGSIGAGVGAGVYFNHRYAATEDPQMQTFRNVAFAAAGVAYWGTLMDGICQYQVPYDPFPAKSTLYSLLLPGLGQLYNGEFWKVPVYWGLIGGGVHFYFLNRKNYLRYKWIYDQATSEDPTVETPPIPAQTALYYRDYFRRMRDYSVLATAVFYFLQVMDANVFAYMRGFEVDDDISLRISPTVQPTLQPLHPAAYGAGLTLNF